MFSDIQHLVAMRHQFSSLEFCSKDVRLQRQLLVKCSTYFSSYLYLLRLFVALSTQALLVVCAGFFWILPMLQQQRMLGTCCGLRYFSSSHICSVCVCWLCFLRPVATFTVFCATTDSGLVLVDAPAEKIKNAAVFSHLQTHIYKKHPMYHDDSLCVLLLVLSRLRSHSV